LSAAVDEDAVPQGFPVVGPGASERVGARFVCPGAGRFGPGRSPDAGAGWAPRATAWALPARVPAARSRLWVIAASTVHALFAGKDPDVIWSPSGGDPGRAPGVLRVPMAAWWMGLPSVVHHGDGGCDAGAAVGDAGLGCGSGTMVCRGIPFHGGPRSSWPPGQRHHARVGSLTAVAGRVKRNLLPPPGLSSTQMRPS
jgi:hypothetical protein